VSPKSRGRPAGRGRPRRSAAPARPLRLSDRLLRDAAVLDDDVDVLSAELWASGWLGQAWVTSPIGEREPEETLCLEVTGRVSTRPTLAGLAALEALLRVAPSSERRLLEETIELVRETHPGTSFEGTWAPTEAWRAVDPWGSERVLFVELDGPVPHTLMANVLTTGGTLTDRLAVLRPGAAKAWDDLREDDDAPMPVAPAPADEVLAEIADALRSTDMLWPRHDDEDFVEHRALAWARCRDHLREIPDWEPTPQAERDALIDAFVETSGLPDDDVTRSLAEVFLDYGDGYLGEAPLGWSPGAVLLFLLDWLPRKVSLDHDQQAALPDVLRHWLRFALTRRQVPEEWIVPVLEAVEQNLAEFRAAYDEDSNWGPAKTVAAYLTGRGIDLTDNDAVQSAMREYNAEQLAPRLIDP
jgi:hypothetical protein